MKDPEIIRCFTDLKDEIEDCTDLDMYWLCTGYVLAMYWLCTGYVLAMYWGGKIGNVNNSGFTTKTVVV